MLLAFILIFVFILSILSIPVNFCFRSLARLQLDGEARILGRLSGRRARETGIAFADSGESGVAHRLGGHPELIDLFLYLFIHHMIITHRAGVAISADGHFVDKRSSHPLASLEDRNYSKCSTGLSKA
jgi:hypothetical protein